jgi:hypothetical protein
MAELPIKRIILYKHGVGYFERHGEFSGSSLRLNFPLEAMDDVLKSLVVIDRSAGQVLGIDFETPEDRRALLAKGSIHLSDDRSLVDLLRDLRGRRVRLVYGKGDDEQNLEGMVVGVDYEDEKRIERAVVAIYQPELRSVSTLELEQLRRLDLLDAAAADDLSYFLRAAQSEEERRSANLHLTPGEHQLVVGYIAPAPAWRVSYRMLYEAAEAAGEDRLLLQGWGLFDNQLEEDLEEVRLTLVAGMPVSFRYRLYEPKTPQRPLFEDEERRVDRPLAYAGAPPPAPKAMAMQAAPAAFADQMAAEPEAAELAAGGFGLTEMSEAVQVAAAGDERGALFAYEVGHPVSVGRGQSAMVPILSSRLACRRELLYNKRKLPKYPVAALRLENQSGLTLERGPVTVLENGDYAGEAVLPFTRAGGEMIVPYAVEMGITVNEDYQSERRMAGVSVRNEYLLLEEYEFFTSRYALTSSLNQDMSVMIEHEPRQGYELADTLQPDEVSAEFMRWIVACAARAQTTFVVRERRLMQRQEQVRSLSMQQLQRYMRSRLLDEELGAALGEIIGLYQRIGGLERQLRDIEKEREKIHKQQTMIQGNLQPLGREGSEGELRQRYVRELTSQEDRLQALSNQEQNLQQQIADLQRDAGQRLALLNAGSE